MSPKVRRVGLHLDSKKITNLSHDEITAILRGADDLIMRGGRSLLVKVLKGSRAQEVLTLGLDQSPVYGYYRHLSPEETLARIDWVLQRGYLAIQYDGRLPLLVYSEAGWEIGRETYADELLRGFDRMLAADRGPFDMSYLKDRNRGLIMRLLDKVEATEDRKYIPVLKAWEQIDYKKVRQEFGRSCTISTSRQPKRAPPPTTHRVASVVRQKSHDERHPGESRGPGGEKGSFQGDLTSWIPAFAGMTALQM